MRGPEAAPAATMLTAAQLQAEKIDEAAARANRVDKSDMLGWWRRKFYVVGNAAFGSVVGMSAGSVAAKALAGTAIAATLPSWAIGAAAAIPTVMAARYLLGLNKVDRMAKAGRVADKLKKQTRKLEKMAARTGHTVTMDDRELAERAQSLSNRVSWGAVAAGVGAGWLTGTVAYEIHTPDDPRSVTKALKGGASSVWERVSSGSWWYQKASGVWNALFGSVAPTEASPAAQVPAAAHAEVCAAELRRIQGLEADLATARDRIAALSSTVTDLGSHLTRLGDEIVLSRNLQDQLANLRTENAELLLRANRSELTGDALVERVRALDERAAELRTEIQRLAAENARLQGGPGSVPFYEAPRGGPPLIHPGVEPSVFVPDAGPFVDMPHKVDITREIARGGLDNLLHSTILARLDDASQLVKNQLIEAVRAAFIADPQSAAQLLGANHGIIRNGDLVFHAGRIADMTVFGDQQFLDRLFDEISARGRGDGGFKYSYLMEYLARDPRGAAGFVEALHAAFQR